MLYEKALLDKWTAYAVEETAQEKLKEAMRDGIGKAFEKGMKNGMKKGMEKGIEKGLEIGMEKGKEQVVRRLISSFNFTDEQAASAAEVSTVFVKKIRASLKKKKK